MKSKLNISHAATFAFIISFFFIEVDRNNGIWISLYTRYLEVGILLAAIFIFFLKEKIHTKKMLIFLFAVCGVFILQSVYILWFQQTPIFGSFSDYLVKFTRSYFYIVLTAGFALFLFDKDQFVSMFWRIGKPVLWVCLISFVLYKVTSINLLLNLYGSSARVQGFFSEPSALAPFLSAFIALSIKYKSKFYLLLTCVIIYLTKSPIVYMTAILSLPLMYCLRMQNATRRVLLLCIGIIVCLVGYSIIMKMDGYSLMVEGHGFKSSLGKLVLGIQNILTGGEIGRNSRFAGAMNVITELKNHDLLYTGYGLNSSSVYFNQLYQGTQASSLMVEMLFSYGIIGMVIFILICTKTLFNVSKVGGNFFFIFVPFLVSCTINSAQGFVSYKFVLLGIFAYLITRFENKYVRLPQVSVVQKNVVQ